MCVRIVHITAVCHATQLHNTIGTEFMSVMSVLPYLSMSYIEVVLSVGHIILPSGTLLQWFSVPCGWCKRFPRYSIKKKKCIQPVSTCGFAELYFICPHSLNCHPVIHVNYPFIIYRMSIVHVGINNNFAHLLKLLNFWNLHKASTFFLLQSVFAVTWLSLLFFFFVCDRTVFHKSHHCDPTSYLHPQTF